MALDEIKVSILVCTHNRADDVIACMEALTQGGISETIEVILVDSGSTDHHARRIADYANAHAFIRFRRLQQAGTSLARNTALNMAKGEWVWWLDDDALPDADWRQQVTASIETADATTAVIGGRVTPIYPPGSDTQHLTLRWKLLISCMDEDSPGYVSDGFNVACANMLMRRLPVVNIGGFSENVGRIGAHHLVSGEENLVIEMLETAGYKAFYTPDLKVRHKVAANRLTLEWVGRRAFAEGISIATINKILKRKRPLSQHPLKLHATLFAFGLMLMIRPNNPDLIIRRGIAAGILNAQA
jgi:glycosyltransferase involved in cell wall biosynthesis